MMQTLRPAVFLDRDGTLNQDIGYLYRPEDWQWCQGVPQALALLQAAGYMLIVVSNQSGIARGLYSAVAVEQLHQWVNTALMPYNVQIDAFYYCPHHPEITGACCCRKPAAGLLLQAAREHHVDLSHSWMIGDAMRDVMAGNAAGCKSILITAQSLALHDASYLCVPDMMAAATAILQCSDNPPVMPPADLEEGIK